MITYEWVVEVHADDDIVATHTYKYLIAAKRFAEDIDAAICLRRIANIFGVINTQYAYPGDTEFDEGADIPRKLVSELLGLFPSNPTKADPHFIFASPVRQPAYV